MGNAWPPMRDPKYIGPEFRTCEGAKKAKLAADLRQYGVDPEDLEP